jgi:hypothetical protein
MNAEVPRLAAQQRALLALIKDRPVSKPAPHPEPRTENSDPYLELVRNSRGLAMVRTVTARWLRFDVERHALLTSAVLAHSGRFEAELARLCRDPGTPLAIDALGLYFVERHIADADALVAAVASTERALLLIARGDRPRHDVSWDRDPAAVLGALLAGQAPPEATLGNFRVIVSRALPQLIEVRQEPQR